VQTPAGVKVVKIVEDARRPDPRLRRRPVSVRPSAVPAPLGREGEQSLAASAAPGSPVQFCGPDGIGKTALLKHHAHEATGPGEGVVFLSARRKSLDDLGPTLVDAFWECDGAYVPSPAQLGRFLADRAALIVLDDLGLDRDDVDVLVDLAPRSTWLLASRERTLWGRGDSAALSGLTPEAGGQLIEAQLGRGLTQAERQAAAQIAQALGGHPQRLIEAAAIVADGHATLEQLAGSPGEVHTPPYVLSDSQLRILAVLAAADGAAVGTDHVAAVSGDSGAARELAGLERHGWAKSGSPRYRLVRDLPGGAPDPPVAALMNQLTAHARSGGPIADDAEAIEGALREGVTRQHWNEAVDLAIAAERPLSTAGLLGSWERVLWLGEDAARSARRPRDAAWFLHQLGSRAMCVGATEQAGKLLNDALSERERIGDRDGADLTRHNLDQLHGGGGAPPGGNGHHPWRPPGPALLAAAAAALVAGVGIALLAGGDDDGAGTTRTAAPAGQQTTTTQPAGGAGASGGGSTSTPPPGAPIHPRIVIASPMKDGRYRAGEKVIADYECTPAAPDRQIVKCQGTADIGKAIDTSPGTHPFTVEAVDETGDIAADGVVYTAERGGGDDAPPDVAPPSDAAEPSEPPPNPSEGGTP
jgi:hypothetical protein